MPGGIKALQLIAKLQRQWFQKVDLCVVNAKVSLAGF